ncbi:MAG: formate dehydrogenase [Nitrospirae bacterium RBG_16_64_22]|nr:MAG: formate dehydrogenase [Nitrospirae bacterium RBG_16_64_22]
MDVSRRNFLKLAGAVSAGSALGGLSMARPIHAYAKDLPTKGAKEVPTLCPYCAVGCGQIAHVRDGKLVNLEGDASHPISRGRLCSKGAATYQMTVNDRRLTKVLYRAPGASEWQEKPYDWALQEVAKRFKATRDATFVEKDGGALVNRCDGIAWIGSACTDNEECYLFAKLARSAGIVSLEHQARL